MQIEVWLSTQYFVTNEVSSFTVEHLLGMPASCTVDFNTGTPVTLDQLVGSMTRLAYDCAGELSHSVVGVVDWVELACEGSSSNANAPAIGYRLHFISRIGLLAGEVTSRIFQNKTVKEIVGLVLADHGIVDADVDFRLVDAHPTWEYCVQYQETSLNFISRILEREGIYFFSEIDTESGREILRFRDDSTLAQPIDEPCSLELHKRSALLSSQAAVYRFEPHQRLAEGRVVLTDYDFKQPHLRLCAEVEAESGSLLESHHFPGDFTDVETGKQLASVRLQAARVDTAGWTVAGPLPNLAAGHKVTIIADEGSHEVFIHSVVHRYQVRAIDSARPSDASGDFEAVAETIPVQTKYRTPSLHEKPIIYGAQTAYVMAPDGAEPEEICTDEHARCKVRFHWDRTDIINDQASCWIRVAQLQSSGSMALPRIGWEVVVEFVNGDPDRPLVTGLLYNGRHMPPYALPDGATRSALRSSSSPGGGGINEIRFEDKSGAEEIMIGAQYDMAITAANNRTRTITQNETVVVGGNSTTEIGADEKITIGKGSKTQIDGDHTVTVRGNRKLEVNAVAGLTVAGDSTSSVSGNQFEMNGNPLAGLVAVVTAKAAAVVQAKADQAIASIQGAVQGQIDQLMGPINALTARAEGLGGAMKAFGDGDTSLAGVLAADVGALATAGLGGPGGGGLAAFRSAPGGGDPAGIIASTNAINSTLDDAVGGLVAKGRAAVKAKDAIQGGDGQAASGGDGKSMDNQSGPDGDLEGFSASDKETGPGYAQYTVTGEHTETTKTAHITAVAEGVNLNVTGSMTQRVGAALIEITRKDHAESVEGVKTEKQLGLVVATKGSESETTTGSLAYSIGGALIEKVSGTMQVGADAPATFIGAMHKIEATSSITLTCGASSITIDGGGIVIKSPLVTFAGSSMTVTKETSHS